MEEYKQLLEASKRFTQTGKLDDAASALELASDQVNKTDCPERKYIISQAQALRKKARSFINPKRTADDMAKILEIVKRTYRVTSADSLDDYLIYFEWDRAQKDRFYMPRRFALLPIVEQIERLAKGEIDILGVSLPPGTGKALADETPVLTECGWKQHGELVAGDKVFSPDGRSVKVIAVHPKCEMEYLVTFSNGESVECHGNHLWTVYNKHKGKAETIATKDMVSGIENSMEGRGHRYYYLLPRTSALEGNKKHLIVAPYTLGVWLGDGTNRNPTITLPASDYAIIDGIIKDGYKLRWTAKNAATGCMAYGFDFRSRLQYFGMCHSRKTTEKHIPEEYMTASLSQRLDLLAGLIDTDGTRSGSKYHFSTASARMKEDFVKLVSTFGWRCSITKYRARTSSSGVIGRKDVYTIGFTPSFGIPCRIERKQMQEFGEQRRISITSITAIGVGKTGNCITVEGGEYLVGNTLIPTHNSTLAMFALTWMAGRRPDKGMLIGSHSASILQGMYDEILRLLKDEEYNFGPAFGLKVASTNALNMQINIGKAKRFANFQFASKDSNLAGKVRAQSLLYLDDLVGSMDEAMNAAAMEKLWQQLTADYFQRREDKCPTLIIGTRWSVNDPIGRLESINARNERAVFLKIPALNDDGESNFDYGEEHSGYTTAGYLKMKEDMDDLAWKSLYMQEPVEREGQLYNRDTLKRFFELPDGEPDAVLSVCDTSNGKGDFNSMPIAYVYGEEHYIADVCFTDAFPEIADRQLANKLIKHDVQRCQFESNNAGERIADKIQEMIKDECRTKITKKHTQENKETKIVVNSDWVKEHCLFLDDSIIEKGSDYDKFMRQLTSYSTRGRNQHDDAADSMAQYALFIHGSIRPKAVLVNRRNFGI